MQRIACDPRPDWQARVESQGLQYHTLDGQPYWDERAYYHFTTGEIDEIELATNTLYDLCLKAVQHLVDTNRFVDFGITPQFVDWIKESWEKDELSLYGRFDFAYDGKSPPKLLEYNADTPTALLEAAVVQWFWLQDVHKGRDQFNSIHEKLLEFWPRLGPTTQGPVHFASARGHLEDFMTANYLRDTAMQTGLETIYLPVEDIGWNRVRNAFVDLDERPIRTCYKLYPWEWMLAEEFAPHLLEYRIRWLEPPWKVLLSNKAILVVLWELFPECPYLLPAFFEPKTDNYVRKPTQAREGANVQIVRAGQVVHETGGEYGEGPFVYQALAELPTYSGNTPVLGSWVVNGYACGMGIREDATPVTSNLSRFVPHLFGG
ncbi:MAG: glutathionylspermidine synthase family protein [Gemmataceae bacterium]